MTAGHFLGGVAALVWDPVTRRYLLLRRSASKDFAPGVWECVTGRVEQGEGFEEAVRREVSEEVGVEVELDFLIGTTHFYRGTARAENELLGIIYHCTSVGTSPIVTSPEHDESLWVTAAEAATLLNQSNPAEEWLYRVIARADFLRQYLPADVVRLNRASGFEMG